MKLVDQPRHSWPRTGKGIRPGRTTRGRAGPLTVALLMLGMLAVGGCGGLLEVENEQDISDSDLNNPDAFQPVIVGVAGDYAEMYADAVNGLGLFASELIHTGSFPSWREFEKGIGTRPVSEGDDIYNDLARAVFVAEDAVRRIEEVVDDPDSRTATAEALIYSGYGHLMLADNYCQATFNGGPPVQPSEVYQRAEQRFSRALSVARNVGDSELERRALAGRARTRLMLENYSGARDDATQIPRGFEFLALYSSNSGPEENAVADLTTTSERREAGVHPKFYEDSAFIADPRTPFIDRGPNETGPDPTRQYVEQQKYPTVDSDIPIATWQEARLIEAEAELNLENLDRTEDLINEVRAEAGLSPYDGPQAESALMAQLKYERMAELWLQAQHFNDVVRWEDPFVQEKGIDTCIEIGETEWQSNPNLGG